MDEIMKQAWQEASAELGKEMNPRPTPIVLPSRTGCKNGMCGIRRVYPPAFKYPPIKVTPLVKVPVSNKIPIRKPNA